LQDRDGAPDVAATLLWRVKAAVDKAGEARRAGSVRQAGAVEREGVAGQKNLL
jgi:hypothetical protein